jgi:hypothetical protein
MSKGGRNQTVTQTNKIDPEARAAYLSNLDLARSTAGGLGVQQYAGFDPRYEAGEAALYEASMKPFGAEDIQAFQNPYENQVVQQSLQDIEQSRQMAALRDAQQATAAKAFGGSRAGVQSALTNEAALREAARTAGQLRSAGFGQAAQLAAAARQMNMQGYQNAMNLGLTRQQYAQMKMDAERNLPLQRLAIQQSAMSAQPANLGSTSTSTQPMQRNIGSGILGGALAGASLAGMPGMAALGPWGALGGAALGGLLA